MLENTGVGFSYESHSDPDEIRPPVVYNEVIKNRWVLLSS